MTGVPRRLVTVGLAALAVLALPNVASAEIRPGNATDPAGDSAGTPSQDIVSASAQYDTNGQVIVTATMNGDIKSGPASFYSFKVASYSPPDQCTGASASLFGFSDGQYSTTMVTGISGTGSAPITVNGNTISFSASGTALQNKDWSCMTLVVTPKDNGAQTLDQLNAPLYFTGYGPDTDGDGVKDNQDQCPSQPGPAPSGCPTTQTTQSTPSTGTVIGKTCNPPALKGKTLSAAKIALKKANCKLGTVTRPKKVKKGTKLVVKKQSGKGPVNVTLGPRKKPS